MLKKIRVDQLAEGMYIHELCASWMDTPFWTKKFLVDSVSLLAKVKNCGIRELVIDTNKGKDIANNVISEPKEVSISSPKRDVAPKLTKGASTAEEFSQAAKVIAQSRDAVTSMFNEARMGRVTGIENSAILVDMIAESVIRNQHALVALSRLKGADDYTYMHSVAVCALMIALAIQLGLSEEALLHKSMRTTICPIPC